MASGTRLPAARRRQQLLDVALRVFSERGFHETSMNEVAEAAGVTKPVLYQHFGSKHDLFRELVTDVGGRLKEEIIQATAAATNPRRQVEDGFRAYFRFAADHPEAFRVLFGGAARREVDLASEARKVEDTMAHVVASLIDVPGLSEEERTLLGYGVVGLAEGASRQWMTAGDGLDPDRVAARCADLAWAGLRSVRATD